MKRFYKEADLEVSGNDARLLLDGRVVKSPAKAEMVLPAGGFANVVMGEWAAQAEEIDPATMPFTRLANSVIDGVSQRRGEVIASITGYSATDLLCHWADAPEALVARQDAAWSPVLTWAEGYLGVPIARAAGVLALTQDERLAPAIETDIAAFDDFTLAAFHEMTTLLGSVFLSLSVARSKTDADAAWAAAHVDETFQAEQWGEDAEAAERLKVRRQSFDDATRAFELLVS